MSRKKMKMMKGLCVDSFSGAILRPFLASLIFEVDKTFLPLQGLDTKSHKQGRHISRPIWWFRTNNNTWIILEQSTVPVVFW